MSPGSKGRLPRRGCALWIRVSLHLQPRFRPPVYLRRPSLDVWSCLAGPDEVCSASDVEAEESPGFINFRAESARKAAS